MNKSVLSGQYCVVDQSLPFYCFGRKRRKESKQIRNEFRKWQTLVELP